jgi:hypothetical protein
MKQWVKLRLMAHMFGRVLGDLTTLVARHPAGVRVVS